MFTVFAVFGTRSAFSGQRVRFGFLWAERKRLVAPWTGVVITNVLIEAVFDL